MSLKSKLTPGLTQAIAERKTSAKEVAILLGVSESHLSRTLKMMGVEKTPPPTIMQKKRGHELNIARINFRTQLAARVIMQELSVEEAADKAYCSVRTMYRYVEYAKMRSTVQVQLSVDPLTLAKDRIDAMGRK